jgi:phosphate/phosphite/phosphonate ABC transporter binding protein
MSRPVRFATFLAPHMRDVYAFIVRRIGERLGIATELFVGTDYAQTDEADAAFICGLAYIELADAGCALEAVAAPVLSGDRYRGRPVYFSDVIVRRDSPFRSFADLRGRTWCYNELLSHSGYGITRYRLTQMAETAGYFAEVIEAGWHERSIRLVCAGEIDGSAIDSHVLALTLREQPALQEQLRVIDSFGPSTVQPVAVSRCLPERLRQGIREVLLSLGKTRDEREQLARGLLDRFVPVNDRSYDDLRTMRESCRAADFLTLR